MLSYEMKLEKRMQQCKQDCLEALTGIVHPEYINKIAIVLAYAYDQEDDVAQSIASDLNLDELNFLAVLDREKDFEVALIDQLQKDYEDNLQYEEIVL